MLEIIFLAYRLIASSKGLLVLSPTVKYEEIWTAISAAVSCSTPVIAKADVQQAFPFLIQAKCNSHSIQPACQLKLGKSTCFTVWS